MATTENSSAVGNAQKMREALIHTRSAICKFAKYQCDSLSWENSNIQANCGDVLCSWRDLCDAKTAINAALAAPLRNCDVGTAEEQAERFNDYCRKQGNGCCIGKGKGTCPIFKRYKIDCGLVWAQMPYVSEVSNGK